MVIDVARAAKSSTSGKVDAKEHKQRVYEMLRSRVEDQGEQGAFIDISPLGDGSRLYPLPDKNKGGEPRDSILSLYIDQYGITAPVATYSAALADLWREIGEPPAQDRAQANRSGSEAEKRERGRPKAKLSPDDIAALEAISMFSDWQANGPYPGSLYARVPYITDARGFSYAIPKDLSEKYTGMWYLPGQEKPPVRKTDIAFYITDCTYPHASSKNKPYAGTLRIVNARGQEKIMPFTAQDLQEKESYKFTHFGTWPQDPALQNRLKNCLQALFVSDPATIWHEEVDSLGYIESETHGLVYALANGIETAQGFLYNEKAPIVAPDIISPGNGYHGTDEKIKVSDELWQQVFNVDDESQARIAAKMGAMMYTWFPPGTVDQAGRSPFYVETIGSPSCGKTPEDNLLKSLQGVTFRYNSPPFTTLYDTVPTAPARMQVMKYLAYSDDDRKHSPGSGAIPGARFLAEHTNRKRMITYYADGAGAGTRYYGKGAAMHIGNRGEPQGLAMGTGNYDHAIYALSTPGLDEDPIEYRACTFVVSAREIRTTEENATIFAQAKEIYATGRAARAWLMRLYNKDRGALRQHLQDTGARARAIMRELFDYEWYETKQQNNCAVMIWGVLVWLEMLKTYGRENCYLAEKLRELLPAIVYDRASRAEYLKNLIEQREGGANLGELVIEAIRQTLAQGAAYIIKQNGDTLAPDDIPEEYAMQSFGYTPRPVVGATTDSPDEIWDHARMVLGHYMKRSQSIAFRMDALANALKPYARDKGHSLPRMDELKERLTSSGVLIEKVATIRGKSDRYLIISLDKLDLPGRAMIDEEELEEQRELQAEADEATEKIRNLDEIRQRMNPPAQVAQVDPNDLLDTGTGIFDFDPFS